MTVVLASVWTSYVGLSTDTKPTPAAGASFFETDTGLRWVYDGSAWSLCPFVREDIKR